MQTISGRPAAHDTHLIAAPAPVRSPAKWAGPAMMFGSALSNQLGAGRVVARI